VLKPLEMGEIIDRSVTFWRGHFGPLFRLYLFFELVVYAVSKAATLAGMRALPFIFGPKLSAAQDPAQLPEIFRQLGIALVGICGLVAVGLYLGWWISFAGTHYCVEQTLGRPTTMSQSLRRARKRTGTLTAAWALSLGAGLFAGLLLAVPGIAVMGGSVVIWSQHELGGFALFVLGLGLALLGEVLAGLWYVLRFMVTAQTLAVEEGGARAALRRSLDLMSGRVGPGFFAVAKVRATILITAMVLIRLTVGLLGSLPQLIINGLYGHLFDATKQDLSAVPQALLVPAELLNVVVQSAFSPLYLIFCALFYLDLRVRREGLDLQLQLGGDASRSA
jgi:hypothetical protein